VIYILIFKAFGYKYVIQIWRRVVWREKQRIPNRKTNYFNSYLPHVLPPYGQKGNIDLPPVCLALVCQIIQNLRDMVVAIISNYIMIGFAEHIICFLYGLVPLLWRVLIMVQYNIFDWGSECKFTRMHGPSPYEIIYCAVRSADAGVTDTWQAASEAG